MIDFKDHKTLDMFDNWRHLGPKRRKRLDQSWAGLFREHILTRLPVEDVAKHYDHDQGRPSKELFASLGAILLQQLLDLTDEETADEIAFNIKWHYALDIGDESDEAKYFCEAFPRNFAIVTASAVSDIFPWSNRRRQKRRSIRLRRTFTIYRSSLPETNPSCP